MQSATLARFSLSGEILSEEVVADLTQKKCALPHANIHEGDFAAAWDLLSEQWQTIRTEVGGYDTERLRRRWVLPLLSVLGYAPEYLRAHVAYGESRTIPLTHRSDGLPLWLLDYDRSPDQRPEGGRRRISPHEWFQEYLDQTDDDWGIFCNGSRLRLLHDYHKTLTRNYVEADLESIFESLDVDAFRAVWRIFRAEQLAPRSGGPPPIEALREHSLKAGAAIGVELRKQVLLALRALGNGFLRSNPTLLSAVRAEPAGPALLYRALLRVVYRLLFLLYIENRTGWTPAKDPIWASSYSISRLRERAEERTSSDDSPGAYRVARADAEDYWEGLKVVFRVVREGSDDFEIHPYGGELFDDEGLWLLKEASLRNGPLLQAIRLLTLFEDHKTRQSHRVNFQTIRIDALGSVYEALLDIAPVISADARFEFAAGAERKLTGSYYTPPELVASLIESALQPVIEAKLAGLTDGVEQEAALLSLRVVDPACGSGAFLIQALDTLALRLCAIRLEGEEPAELDLREARRDVVTHCIHGVDLNPMAVELCKFTLWLQVAHPKLPLSYLEPRIKCGNALVGAPLPRQVQEAKAEAEAEAGRIQEEFRAGRLSAAQAKRKQAAAVYAGWPDVVPSAAFAPVADDRKEIAARVVAKNTAQVAAAQAGQGELDWLVIGRLADWYDRVNGMGEATMEEVRRKADAYRSFVLSDAYGPAKAAADTWCAAFFWPHDGAEAHELPPTTSEYKKVERNPHHAEYSTRQKVERIARTLRFFHWHLEFRDVFRAGGFDCVLGNPPWKVSHVSEKKFFATAAPEIATVNTAKRAPLIAALQQSNPALFEAYQIARRSSGTVGKFMHASGRYHLTAAGKLNTYALFAEADFAFLGPSGRTGFLAPTGLVADKTASRYFSALVRAQALARLLDFENREKLFGAVDSRFKFSAITLSRQPSPAAETYFFLTRADQVADARRRIALSPADIALMNPNTLTSPIFRTEADAQLTRTIYERVPVLWNEPLDSNPWDIHFYQGLFNMANASSLFHGTPGEGDLPLYEAKLLHQFDHRWATYAGVDLAAKWAKPRDTEEDDEDTPPDEEDEGPAARDCTAAEKADPGFRVTPRYWVSEDEVLLRAAGLGVAEQKALRARSAAERRAALLADAPKWLLAFRDIARSTDERTAIVSFLPFAGVGHQAPLLRSDAPLSRVSCLVGNLNSLTLDYAARRKLGGTHLTYDYVKQFPVLPPEAYAEADVYFIGERVRELVYTAWEMKPWAEAMGYDGPPFPWDEERRALLRADLDAWFARLYGLTRKQLRYLLDPHGLSDRELEDILDPWEEPACAGPHLLPDSPSQDFPGETFRVLKKHDEHFHGDYRTRRLVLAAWARLEAERGPAQPRDYHALALAAGAEQPSPRPPEFRASASTQPAASALREAAGSYAAAEPALALATPGPQALRDAEGNPLRVRIYDAEGAVTLRSGLALARKRVGSVTTWIVQGDGEASPRRFQSPPAVVKRLLPRPETCK